MFGEHSSDLIQLRVNAAPHHAQASTYVLPLDTLLGACMASTCPPLSVELWWRIVGLKFSHEKKWDHDHESRDQLPRANPRINCELTRYQIGRRMRRKEAFPSLFPVLQRSLSSQR